MGTIVLLEIIIATFRASYSYHTLDALNHCTTMHAQEELVPPFLRTVAALSDARTTILIASERRNEIVYRMFEERASEVFKVKRLPMSKQHAAAMNEVGR